jgi:hypothetical protein
MPVKKKSKDEAKSADIESVFDESHEEEVKVEVISEEESDEASMPMSAVEELLKRAEERITNSFNKKLQSLKLGKAKQEMEAASDYVADLEDDWLESPAVFFAYSINFSIHGDKRLGKDIQSPQGAIRFKPIIRSKRQTQKGVEVISVSSVKIHSKAVAEWLRTHSSFGIAFFENMESALNIDSGWAQRLIEANQSIQRLSDQQIIARSRQEGLPISTDPVQMRKDLVEHIATRSIKKHNELQYGKLRNSVVEGDRQIEERKINA